MESLATDLPLTIYCCKALYLRCFQVLTTPQALVLKLILQVCTTLPLNAMCTISTWFINVRKTSWKKIILEHKYNRRVFFVVEIVLSEKRSKDTTFIFATYHSYDWFPTSGNDEETCFWFSNITECSSYHNSLFWKISTLKILTLQCITSKNGQIYSKNLATRSLHDF